MSWPNPFYRSTPNTRSAWGYVFEWTDEHLSLEASEPLKHSCDTLADDCLDILNELSPLTARSVLPRNRERAEEQEHKRAEGQDQKDPASSPIPTRDLYALLRDNADSNETLKQMWTQVNTVPDWVDWKQIERGQDAFYRYGGAAITGLAFQSLLGGMGAARVTETLARTGGFSPKVARGRLFETTQVRTSRISFRCLD